MNKYGQQGVVVELDSYRLAKYAVQVPCFVCDGDNTFDAERCRTCAAPMALVYQARTQKVRPKLIAAIGPPGVGRSVHLGMMLDMLGRIPKFQAISRGAYSLALQQEVIAALCDGDFPAPTCAESHSWHWTHLQLVPKQRRRPVDIIVPDIPGAALLEESRKSGEYPAVPAVFRKVAGAFLFADTEKLANRDAEHEHALLRLMNQMVDVAESNGQTWRSRPLAVVLTKSNRDDATCADPVKFVESAAPAIEQFCRHAFPQHAYFASSIAGAVGMRVLPDGSARRAPLRIEPRGVLEPLNWLLSRLK